MNISGYRVHLNEIQRMINTIKGIEDSEVMVLDTKHGEKILVFAIILTNSDSVHKDSELKLIKEHLSEELPNYMMAINVAIMEKFSHFSSGKIDRKMLLSILEKDVNDFGLQSWK